MVARESANQWGQRTEGTKMLSPREALKGRCQKPRADCRNHGTEQRTQLRTVHAAQLWARDSWAQPQGSENTNKDKTLRAEQRATGTPGSKPRLRTLSNGRTGRPTSVLLLQS